MIGEEAFPDEAVTGDVAIEAHIRETFDTIYHPVGTCKMGTDAQAVVEPQLRVHGVEALRLMDASIMPTIPSSPTSASCIMIGEKGARTGGRFVAGEHSRPRAAV
jgi:choline dehydrogenase